VCERECFRVLQCARMCVYVRVHANVLVLYLQNCANAQASHIQSSFRTHGEFENENTFALCTHTAAALQLSVRVTSDQSNFWCLDIFLLGHSVT